MKGRYLHGKYILIKPPEGYPGHRYRGLYVLEHHVVYWQNTGRTVPKGYAIHHKDENGYNNSISNLELMKWEDHARHHHKDRGIGVWLQCTECKTKFLLEGGRYRYKIKIGQEDFNCSRSCTVKMQWRLKLNGGLV